MPVRKPVLSESLFVHTKPTGSHKKLTFRASPGNMHVLISHMTNPDSSTNAPFMMPLADTIEDLERIHYALGRYIRALKGE